MTVVNSGQFFAKALERQGISHVFMVPAVFPSAMVAIEDTAIKRVTTHNEMAAAYMADGFARAGRRPGICMAQAVGAAHIAAGLRDAHLASSPVIAITGGPVGDSHYRYLYQINEDFPMYEAVTKFNARVDTPDRLPDLLRQAFRVSTTGSPGPVHLEIPGRLAEGAMGDIEDPGLGDLGKYASYPAHRPDPEAGDVAAAARALSTARRPVIIAGGGTVISGAHAELVALAEALAAPVATSPSGKEAIADEHPLSIGLVGTYGRACANQLVLEADLVLLVGTRAGGLTTGNWHIPSRNARVIQIDIDPYEIGRNYPSEIGLCGDAKKTLAALLAALDQEVAPRTEWAGRARSLVVAWRKEMAAARASNASPMRPERICSEISEALPPDGVVVSDTGHAAIWSGNMIDLKPGQRYIRCAGTLGWAFPASLGAKCALPDRHVLCFTGDGGLYYHLAELETAARAGINVVVVVNNNGALQQVRRGIDAAYGGTQRGRAKEMWVFREGVNLARIAEEMGCIGIRVERPELLRGALDEAFGASRPVLIDAVSDIDAAPPWG